MDVLSFRINEFDMKVLKAQARKREVTLSSLVNQIVSGWVDSLLDRGEEGESDKKDH